MIREVYPLRRSMVIEHFLTLKLSNGNYRMILDLTKFNKLVEYNHFKMFNLNTALDLLTPNCFMASVDLTDAYYEVSIAAEHRRFLRFKWEDKHFEYQVLPNGLSPGPSLFT